MNFDNRRAIQGQAVPALYAQWAKHAIESAGKYVETVRRVPDPASKAAQTGAWIVCLSLGGRVDTHATRPPAILHGVLLEPRTAGLKEEISNDQEDYAICRKNRSGP